MFGVALSYIHICHSSFIVLPWKKREKAGYSFSLAQTPVFIYRNLRHPFPARAGCNVLLRGLAVFLKQESGFLRAVHLPEFIKPELIFLHNQRFFIFNKEKSEDSGTFGFSNLKIKIF